MQQGLKQQRKPRPFQVDCSSEEQVKEASIALGSDGGVFECTVGRITKRAISTLDDAFYAHAPVQIRFANRSLLLDLESLESSEPHTVRIVGRILDSEDRETA